MRIVYMGTPDFAVAPMAALIQAGFNIVAVITVPDKPAGRGQQLQQSAVKQYALSKDIPVLQPEKLRDDNFINQLQSFNADLQVVVAFRMLPEVVWAMPKYGTLNLHASLLPQYRGAAPINWAIINGEKETGVTTFFIEHEIDTGNIIFQQSVPIEPFENAGTLHDKLMETGAELIVKTVRAIAANNYPKIPQSQLPQAHQILMPAPKIFKEHCRIDWNKPCFDIVNFINGLSPYPTAWTELIDNKGSVLSLKLFEASFESATSNKFKVGEVYSDGKTFLKVAASNGLVSIKQLQLQGKKKLLIEEFLRGIHNIEHFSIK